MKLNMKWLSILVMLAVLLMTPDSGEPAGKNGCGPDPSA